MYRFKGNTIYLVRGDTLQAQLSIKRNNETYIPVEGDVIRFALKKNELNYNKTQYVDKQPLIIKEIPIDTMILSLSSDDTKNLDFGSYAYDIQITLANGTVDTFIMDKLYLKPEVD